MGYDDAKGGGAVAQALGRLEGEAYARVSRGRGYVIRPRRNGGGEPQPVGDNPEVQAWRNWQARQAAGEAQWEPRLGYAEAQEGQVPLEGAAFGSRGVTYRPPLGPANDLAMTDEMYRAVRPEYRGELEAVPVRIIPDDPDYSGFYDPPPVGPRIEITQQAWDPFTFTHEAGHAYMTPRYGMKPGWTVPLEPPGFSFSLNPRANFDPFAGLPPGQRVYYLHGQEKPLQPGFHFNRDIRTGAGWESYLRALARVQGPKVSREYGFAGPMENYSTWAELMDPLQIPEPLRVFYPWLQDGGPP